MATVVTPASASQGFVPPNASQNTTAQLDLNDPLTRKQWIKQKLIVAMQRTNLFNAYIGNSASSVIYRSTRTAQNAKQAITFDYDGFLVNPPIMGKSRAEGKGEVQKYFSDELTMHFYRFVRDNGWAVEGSAYDKVNNTKHSYAMGQLANLNARWVHQSMADALQGTMTHCAPSHIIRPNGKTTMAALTSADTPTLKFVRKLEEAASEGWGFTNGANRLPLVPSNSSGRYTVFVDSTFFRLLRESTDFRDLAQYDVRGERNMAIRGYLGTFGNLDFVAVPTFHGTTLNRHLGGTGVMLPGWRLFNKDGKMSGEQGFSVSNDLVGRGVIVGQSALRMASGPTPEYRYETYDAGEFSESFLRGFFNVAPAVYREHNTDYSTKITGYNFGLIHFEYFIGKRG